MDSTLSTVPPPEMVLLAVLDNVAVMLADLLVDLVLVALGVAVGMSDGVHVSVEVADVESVAVFVSDRVCVGDEESVTLVM